MERACAQRAAESEIGPERLMSAAPPVSVVLEQQRRTQRQRRQAIVVPPNVSRPCPFAAGFDPSIEVAQQTRVNGLDYPNERWQSLKPLMSAFDNATFRLEMPMRISAWIDVVRPLIIGAAVYLVMRFLVPHSLGEEQRSLIGGGVAFVVAMVVLGLDRTTRT